MPLMSSELFDALIEAGASDEKARKAAEAVAAFENRFADIRTDLAGIKTSLDWLHVFLGVNLTVSMVILGKLFVFPGVH
jgi:hypothetical protein